MNNPTAPRKYPRASFHDYNGGDYFITVCTRGKLHYFGEIHDQQMRLSTIGKILTDNLQAINQHFHDVEIPLFVVMPNHFHAIISIRPNTNTTNNVGSRPAATEATATQPQPAATDAITNLGRLNQLARLSVATGSDPASTTHHNTRLSVVIGSIKSHVTRHARRAGIEFAWQTRYHDHIIRGTRDGNKIADYIETNVIRWETDCCYTH